jgi:molybdopterin-guanine dinucleotide biosynthesis protein A
VKIPQTTAFILAGGKSSRMGADKAFLQLGAKSLLERAVSTAKQVCETVVLIGDRKRLDPYGPVVEDVFPGHGPLAGIHAGLKSNYSSEFNLVLSVDIPGVTAEFLDYILKTAQGDGAQITVPRAGDHVHTLCAVYRREFADIAEQALRESRNKIEPLFRQVITRTISEDEMKAVGFLPDIFDNVNTPEDWRKMRQRLGEASE